jgi:hypothetical protein
VEGQVQQLTSIVSQSIVSNANSLRSTAAVIRPVFLNRGVKLSETRGLESGLQEVKKKGRTGNYEEN